MEQFGFERLSDDDQLELLKYMPIKERVRFERINTNWAGLFGRLWLSQKQLQFGSTFTGQSKCHKIDVIDQYLNSRMPTEVILKIISSCKNLKALQVNSNVFTTMNLAIQLADVLNENCKELEHLDISSINWVFCELFKPTDKFSCLLPLRYDWLKRLCNKNNGLKPMNLKYIDILSLGMFDPDDQATWATINKLTVERLVTDDWNVKFNELINLKSVHVYEGDSDDIANFSQLQDVRLYGATVSGLRRIFKNNPNLVQLGLLGVADKLMTTVTEFGSHLTKMNVLISRSAKFNEYVFWQNLAKLTKLRSLCIEAFGRIYDDNDGNEKYLDTKKLNVNGLILVLKTCTKLKSLSFNGATGEDFITEGEMNEIRKVVAEKSFRRSFKVRFEPSEIIIKLGQ